MRTDKMSVEMIEVRDACIGFFNGIGAGGMLWALIIAGVRAWS